jgi:hypothetical protein
MPGRGGGVFIVHGHLRGSPQCFALGLARTREGKNQPDADF